MYLHIGTRIYGTSRTLKYFCVKDFGAENRAREKTVCAVHVLCMFSIHHTTSVCLQHKQLLLVSVLRLRENGEGGECEECAINGTTIHCVTITLAYMRAWSNMSQ